MNNQSQIDFWNGKGGVTWATAQERMDNMLAPLSQVAVARANPLAEERVIDVGCGCGATSLALADSGAAVWGVDVSEPMLAVAKQRAATYDNVAFSVTDAATAEYTPDHDLIFSRFGVMFFADPIGAFAQLHGGLKPSGRVVFLCWQPPRENPWMSVAARAVQPFMPPAEQADPRAPGPFAFADPEWIKEILNKAGYHNVDIQPVKQQLTVGSDVDDAIGMLTQIGPLSRGMSELDETTRTQAISAVQTALAPHATSAGVQLGAACWLVSASY